MSCKIKREGQLYGLDLTQIRGNTPNTIQNALWNLLEHLVEKHANCPYSRILGAIIRKSVLRTLKIQPLQFLPFGNPTSLTPNMDGRKKYLRPLLRSQCELLIWHHSSKAKYVGQKSIEASTSLAVSTFNDAKGLLHLSWTLCQFLHRIPHFRRYHARNQMREREPYWKHRRDGDDNLQLAPDLLSLLVNDLRRLVPLQIWEIRNRNIESSGGEESDTTCEICKNRVCPIGGRRKSDDWMGCDICECWFHINCIGVNTKFLGDDPYFCDACS